MKDVFAGIDEAGRGAVIGPLVVAGVSVNKTDEGKLEALGLKDSKVLSPARREQLAGDIEKLAQDVVVVKLSACRIDSMRAGGVNLNRIEEMKFADILALMNPGIAYIDSTDVKPGRLKLTLGRDFPNELVVEHRADSRYPVVSAASIIAKVERDREIAKLRKEWGDFGPGYPSNEKTMTWLRTWAKKNRTWPDIVRKSWETAKCIMEEKQQRGVWGFLRRFSGNDGCGKAE